MTNNVSNTLIERLGILTRVVHVAIFGATGGVIVTSALALAVSGCKQIHHESDVESLKAELRETHSLLEVAEARIAELESNAEARTINQSVFRVLDPASVSGHKIGDGQEVVINDGRIARVVLGERNAVVTFKNTGGRTWTPHCDIHIYNTYGVRLGHVPISWFTSIYANETKLNEEKLFRDDVKSVFKRSGIALPSDFVDATFVVVEYHKR